MHGSSVEAEPRSLPASLLSVRRGRDRLSDLEAGTLGDCAFEDEDPLPEEEVLELQVVRRSSSTALGVQLDVWARTPTAAAEVVIGLVYDRSPAQGILQVGDAILSVNGVPCCTIDAVRSAVWGEIDIVFEVRRSKTSSLYSAEALMVQRPGHAPAPASLVITSQLMLEVGPRGGGGAWLAASLRSLGHVSLLPERGVRISAADGSLLMDVTPSSSAEQERIYMLLMQMTMFKPGTRCELTGWLQRQGEGPVDSQYFECYSNGTVLSYANPHRNKLGQGQGALALSEATVVADPSEQGVWLVSDRSRAGVVWRCRSLQPVNSDETAAEVFDRLGRASASA